MPTPAHDLPSRTPSAHGRWWQDPRGWLSLLGALAVLAPLGDLLGWLVHAFGLAALLAALWLERVRHRHHQSRLTDHARRLASELGMAADLHFELDAGGRLLRFTHAGGGQGLLEADDLGRAPWEWAGVELGLLDSQRLQTVLDRGESLRDLPLTRVDAQARRRHLRLSIGPLPAGRMGGVLRDDSAEHAALEAMRQSQARYRELFRRLPQPLVLHREGRLLDANPAAMLLLGHHDSGSLLGSDLTQVFEPGESRERFLASLRQVVTLPLGRHLPPTEYRLSPRPDTQVIAQASSAQVESEDGEPAVLTIFNDVTEHRQAEQALQRSEALLSHLVANSPDLITLTEVSSGRYLMVNPSFTRVSGWSVAEAVGRTSIELGIWASVADRDRFLQQLHRDGTVHNLAMPFRVRDGRTVAMLVSAARFSLDGADYLILSCRDVSASEQARLEREAILENAQMGIALTRNFIFQVANPRLEQMLGWPVGRLAGEHVRVVWSDASEFEAVTAQLLPRLQLGEQVEIERAMTRRDGSSFIGRVLAKAVDPSDPTRGTIWFTEDITPRRQTERALARARDAAEAASRAKSAFLASTSHEIRTPLNALLGLARLARHPATGEARRRAYLDQISDSAETLSGILSDILDLSKIEAGKMHLDQVAFDLHGLLDALAQAYGALADTKGLVFGSVRDEDLPEQVLGDAMRVRQVLSNFLNNALKYTDSGRIDLRARVLREGLLRFEVSDTGRGIEASVQARLFQPFVQGDEAAARTLGGTGLGLSISRELAELMGGRVGLESQPGVGSVFWVELPLPPVAGDAETPGSTSGGADPLQGARVLMVEDNPVNMMIAVALLEQWGLQVAQAPDGETAVQAVQQAHERGDPFDLVLMDVQMPGISGHEAARRLRAHFDADTLPILALTAAALVSERDEALAAGMNDFLTKPIDANRLRHALRHWLRQR